MTIMKHELRQGLISFAVWTGSIAFLMMVCVAIYALLVAGIQYSDNLSSSLFGVMAYTVILCFSLFKTGSLSKSIFNAH